jgi:hypothetical protein
MKDRHLGTLIAIVLLAVGLSACATQTGSAFSAQAECAHAGGVWRSAMCETQAGGGGGGGAGGGSGM